MGVVVAIGETDELAGFALAGVLVVAAGSATEVNGAWSELPADAGLVILSAAAALTLGDALDERPDVLTVVMP
jgi:vacuolar-type H+-ATPase subunit F/Vma7